VEVQVVRFESTTFLLICAFFRQNITDHKTGHSSLFSALIYNRDLSPSLHIYIYGMVFRHRNKFTFTCYPTPTFLLHFFPCITQQPGETTGPCMSIILTQWIPMFYHTHNCLCYKTCSKTGSHFGIS
jgi:hypothetical protein